MTARLHEAEQRGVRDVDEPVATVVKTSRPRCQASSIDRWEPSASSKCLIDGVGSDGINAGAERRCGDGRDLRIRQDGDQQSWDR